MDTTQKPIIGDSTTIPNLEASGQALLNRNLNTSQITPTSPLNLTPTLTQPTDNGSSIVTGASQTSADIQKYLDMVNSQQPTETQNTFNDLVKSLSGDTSLTGRGEAQLSAEQSAGLPELNKNLADINSQITTKTAAYNKMLADMEVGVRGNGNTDIRSSLLYGQQGAVNRQAAAEIGLLQAQALGLQGQIGAAQTAANRAVDLMYQDREALYNQKLKQLELIQPMLNAEEKKRADATAYALKNESEKLAEEKQAKKDIQNIIITASQSGAPKQLLDQASNATTAIDAAKILGQYSPETLKYQLLKEQIRTEKAQQSNYYANAAKTKAETDKLKNGSTGYVLNQEDTAKAVESKVGQKTIAAKGLVVELSNLKALYEKYGARPTSAEGIGAIQSARSNAQLAITAAFGQGAISEGDRSSYEKLVGTTFGVDPVANLNEAIKTQQRNYETNLNVLNDAYPGINNISSFAQPNPFQESLGASSAPIQGSSIIGGTTQTGQLNFILPTNNTTNKK